MQGNENSEGMTRTSLYMCPEQLEFMKGYKQKKGVSLTHFVRIAVDERIEKLKKQEVGK